MIRPIFEASAYVFMGVLFGFVLPTLTYTPRAPLANSTLKVMIDGGVGSAVHVGRGYAVTAAHVVGDATSVTIKTSTGAEQPAEVLWRNKDYDLALLRVEPKDIAASPLSCTDPTVGQQIRGLGNPLGLEFVHTWGRVASGVEPRDMFRSIYFANMAIAGGYSGGPVFDERGRVVGIMVAVRTAPMGFGTSLSGIAYVVPGSAVCSLLAR